MVGISREFYVVFNFNRRDFDRVGEKFIEVIKKIYCYVLMLLVLVIFKNYDVYLDYRLEIWFILYNIDFFFLFY